MGLICARPPAAWAQSHIVETIAGSGLPNVGDGGPATAAILDNPSHVVIGPAGSLNVVDMGNHRVRRITADGIIQTIAGTGTADNRVVGDGGMATRAQLRFPRGAAFAPDGSLFIADSNYYRVRRIDTDGIITTVAGTGNFEGAFEGLPATQANLSFPRDVAVDAQGALYIADGFRILRVGVDGILRTIAGNGVGGGAGDGGLAINAQIDNSGSLAIFGRTIYFAAPVSGGVRRINLDTGLIATISLNGLNSQAIAVDPAGNLYVASGRTAFRISAGTETLTTLATFDTFIAGIAADAQSNVYVSENERNRVSRIRPDGAVELVAGGHSAVSTGVPAAEATIYDSQGLALDREGSLFFSDFDHGYIRKLDRNGLVTTIAGDGRQQTRGDGGPPLEASFGQARTLGFTTNGSLLFIDELGVGTVRLITPGNDGIINGDASERIITIAGRMAPFSASDRGSADGGPATAAVFDRVRGFALDGRGNLYVADWLDNRIRKVVPGSDGVLNGGADEIITTIAGNGVAATTGDGGLASQASINRPNQIVTDTQNNIYFWEVTTGNIRRIDGNSGIITLFAQTFDVGGSWSLATDATDNLYFATGTQVYRIDASTRLRTLVAGTGTRGFGGDGADAKLALFQGVEYLTSDALGNLYVADNGNFRLRKISRTDPPQIPVVTQQPRSQAVPVGSRVVLRVAATGTPPLSYQWRLNGIDLVGAVAATLIFDAFKATDAGVYSVVISNPVGAATSSGSTLSVTSVVTLPAGFDGTGYLLRYPDLAGFYGADLFGAWLYYLNYGVYDGEIFDELFRGEEYLGLYPELYAIFGTNLSGALLHWLNEGRIEGRLGRIPLEFSAAGYFARNPDVAAAVNSNLILGWQHFWAFGIYEGRAYDDEFRVFEYLALNSDLQAAFLSDWRGATLHWMRYGRTEGRLGRLPVIFNSTNYASLYPNVASVWGTAPTTLWQHFWLYGIDEGKVFDNEFRVDEYLALNPDIQALFGTNRRGALIHWVRYGRAEGRSGKNP